MPDVVPPPAPADSHTRRALLLGLALVAVVFLVGFACAFWLVAG